MSYSYPFYGQQPYLYQDQLNQLRNTPPFQPQRTDGAGFNWVQGETGAKSWFVAPGSSVLLMDSESQRFYLKSADVNGMPSMRTFEYSEIDADRPTVATPQGNFVTSEEFDRFKESIEEKIQELAGPVEVSVTRKKKGENNE